MVGVYPSKRGSYTIRTSFAWISLYSLSTLFVFLMSFKEQQLICNGLHSLLQWKVQDKGGFARKINEGGFAKASVSGMERSGWEGIGQRPVGEFRQLRSCTTRPCHLMIFWLVCLLRGSVFTPDRTFNCWLSQKTNRQQHITDINPAIASLLQSHHRT